MALSHGGLDMKDVIQPIYDEVNKNPFPFTGDLDRVTITLID